MDDIERAVQAKDPMTRFLSWLQAALTWVAGNAMVIGFATLAYVYVCSVWHSFANWPEGASTTRNVVYLLGTLLFWAPLIAFPSAILAMLRTWWVSVPIGMATATFTAALARWRLAVLTVHIVAAGCWVVLTWKHSNWLLSYLTAPASAGGLEWTVTTLLVVGNLVVAMILWRKPGKVRSIFFDNPAGSVS